MNIPITGTAAVDDSGKRAGKALVEGMQNQLRALEDVSDPNNAGRKISIENLVTLLLIERSKNVSSFLGSQAQQLNAMNNQATQLKSKINTLSAINTKGLEAFSKILQDPSIKKALAWYNGTYKPVRILGDKLMTPNDILLTPDQLRAQQPLTPYGWKTPDLTLLQNASSDHPVIPIVSTDLLDDIKAFRPDAGNHIGPVDGLEQSQGTQYIDLRYLAGVADSFHAEINSIHQAFTSAGKPVPDIASIPSGLSGIISGLQNQVKTINQDAQDKVQDMTKTMHYATEYQSIASNLISNFNQEVMASVNRIVV